MGRDPPAGGSARRCAREGRTVRGDCRVVRRGEDRDLPLLASLLGGEDPLTDANEEPATVAAWNADVRVSAANAIPPVSQRRRPHTMSAPDWAVIASYGLGMILIGWYYAGKNKTAEDYLLGGRSMKPDHGRVVAVRHPCSARSAIWPTPAR